MGGYRRAAEIRPDPKCSACGNLLVPANTLLSDDGALLCAKCHAAIEASKRSERWREEHRRGRPARLVEGLVWSLLLLAWLWFSFRAGCRHPPDPAQAPATSAPSSP